MPQPARVTPHNFSPNLFVSPLKFVYSFVVVKRAGLRWIRCCHDDSPFWLGSSISNQYIRNQYPEIYREKRILAHYVYRELACVSEARLHILVSREIVTTLESRLKRNRSSSHLDMVPLLTCSFDLSRENMRSNACNTYIQYNLLFYCTSLYIFIVAGVKPL